MITASLLAIAVMGWITSEVRQHRRFAHDTSRRLYAGLSLTETWTGLWLVEVVGEHADEIRRELFDAKPSEPTPGILAEALLSSPKARVLDHLPGPFALSEEQALTWVESVGPNLSQVRLRPLPGRSNHRLFALAYASKTRPPHRARAPRIIEHLRDSFATTLVSCAQLAPPAALVTQMLRLGAGAAVASAVISSTVCWVRTKRVDVPESPPLASATIAPQQTAKLEPRPEGSVEVTPASSATTASSAFQKPSKPSKPSKSSDKKSGQQAAAPEAKAKADKGSSTKSVDKPKPTAEQPVSEKSGGVK